MALRVSQVFLQVLRSKAISGIPVSATTIVTFAGVGSATNPHRNVSALSTILFTPTLIGGGDIEVVGTTSLIISSNGFAANSSKYVQATTGLVFATAPFNGQVWLVAATSALTLSPAATDRNATGPQALYVSAATQVTLASQADLLAARVFSVSATTQIALSEQTVPAVWGLLLAPAESGLVFGVSSAAIRVANATAATALVLGGSALSGRDVNAVALTALGFAVGQGSNHFEYAAATTSFAFAGSCSVITAGKEAATGFMLFHKADARVVLPTGGGVPGGSQAGLRTVLLADTSGEFPMSFAETPSGLILIANGIDPMQRWDGLTGLADTAGVLPPTQALELGGVGVGTITGRRVAYCRFGDKYGNTSNLSPVSNEVDFGADGLIDRIEYDPRTGQVTITSAGHGRSTGDPILIDGVEGLPISGAYTLTVVDDDRFTLDNLSIVAGTWLGGGRWVFGIANVVYGNVPVPTELKVVRRQILRNLDGNAETFYVDIDTDDLTSTALLSTNDDEALAAGIPLPLFTTEETPHANRFGVPPSHKAVVAAHLGRIFATGDVSYTTGNCQPLFGQSTILGIGTAWRQSMVGRLIYMAGAANAYEIAAVDEANQVITTTAIVQDTTGPFTRYAIRPAPGERKFVYFSEPALPEAWPPWNAISVPEDSDDITGLMVKGSFLYILEKRHIYKFTFQNDPARDGFVFLTTRRGCVNQPCHVQVEDTAYLLDEVGLYAFDGQEAEPISTPIQNLFQQVGLGGLQVNWQADQRYWHAAHDPVRDTIRWFVAMTGFQYPRHAIAYDYRRARFWIEEYPFAMSASAIATIGYRRSIAGSEARRVLCLGEGSLDAVDDGNGLRGTVTSAGPLSLTDSSAPFPPNLAGAPVSIADGRGVLQQRRITANTADTLSIDRPWLVRPDDSSTYQIGGINWTWQSGWFRFVDEELDNNRDVEIIFQPLKCDSSLNLRMYFDHSDEPRVWARTIEQDGVTITDGLPEIAVDLTTRSGFAAHRLTGHRDPMAPGDRYVSVELAGVQAREIHRVYQVAVNGVKSP